MERSGRGATKSVERQVRSPGQLGRWIRQVRRAKGLTQAELAGLAGVGVRFLSELERGKDTAHLGKVLTLLHRLGCRVVVATRLPEAADAR